MVIGTHPYQFIAEQYGRPVVISGFEPLDILQSIWMVLQQLAKGRAEVENQYKRVVSDAGNVAALKAIATVFEVRDWFEWRGLGSIARSGVKIRQEYAAYDAERKFSVPDIKVADPQACQCGAVLKGAIAPWECQLFGSACTPETALGALMVSSEGACAAYYRYGDLDKLLSQRNQQQSDSVGANQSSLASAIDKTN